MRTNISNHKLSFAQFKHEFKKASFSKNQNNKVSNIYEDMPLAIKVLKNFDRTGISGAIIDILEENKQKRERELILSALYFLFISFDQLNSKIKSIEKIKVPILLENYFKYSKNSDFEKIKYFRNILINGLLSKDSSISEDKNIFNIVDGLDIAQLNILKIIYDKQSLYTYADLQNSTTHKITAEELSSRLSLEHFKVKQKCLDLIGKGLIEDWGIGRFDYRGPKDFIMNEYTFQLINMIKENK